MSSRAPVPGHRATPLPFLPPQGGKECEAPSAGAALRNVATVVVARAHWHIETSLAALGSFEGLGTLSWSYAVPVLDELRLSI